MKTKGKEFRVVIEREKLLKQDMKVRREAQINAGIKTPSNKTMKSKKEYTRKPKHRMRFV